MGLFNFFNRNKSIQLNGNDPQLIDIPKDLFIEESGPNEQKQAVHSNGEIKGIDLIYAFLQDNYESRGYDDALINPDDSYKTENIKLIKLDLHILVQKVTTYYEDSIRVTDFHIHSRSRAGLIDLVEELKTRKEMIIEHMSKVSGIKKEMESESGMTQRILLSYQRGFMRGLSAITQSKILGNNL